MNRHGIHRVLSRESRGRAFCSWRKRSLQPMPEGTDEMQSSVVTIRRNARSRRLLPIDHFHFLISLPRLVSLLSSPAPAASSLRSLSLFSFSTKASLRLSYVGFAGLSCLLRFTVLHAVMFLCVRVFVCGIIVCERSLNLLGALLLLDCRCGSRYDLQHFPA